MQKLAAHIPPNIPFRSDKKDEIVRLPNQRGSYTIKSAWQASRIRAHKVLWRNLIWFKEAIPRFAFTTWLAMLNKLPTYDRLLIVGITSTNTCLLCSSSEESVYHLNFYCTYSRETQMLVMAELTPLQPAPWSALMATLYQPPARTLLRNVNFKRRLSALVYYLWMERNYRNFESSHLIPSSLTSMLFSALL